MKKIWSDEEIIEGLQTKKLLDLEAYSAYLRKYTYSVKNFVINDFGTNAYVEYVVENSMSILIQKLKQSSINIDIPLKINVFAITTNFWLKILKDHNLIEKVEPSLYVQFLLDFERGEIETKIRYSNWFNKFWYKIYLSSKLFIQNYFFIVKPIEDIINNKNLFNCRGEKSVQVQCLLHALKGDDNLI